MPTDKRGNRKCSGCGRHYEVRSPLPAPEKPKCALCRQATARAREKYVGWGFPAPVVARKKKGVEHASA